MIFKFLRLRLIKQRRKNRYIQVQPPYSRCKNCNSELTGRYCSVCGQLAVVDNQMLRDSVVSYFENNYSFDNKLWITLGFLFSKPGYLSREFMNGRIVRYVHPFKLYFFSSILLFGLVVGLTSADKASNTKEIATSTADSTNMLKEALASITDSLKQRQAGLTAAEATRLRTHIDSLTRSCLPSHSVHTSNQHANELAALTPEERKQKMIHYFSISILLLMPIFGGLLLFFYRDKDPRYASHFIHAIHLHVLLFILIALGVLADKYLFRNDVTIQWLLVLWGIYFIVSLSRFYEERKRVCIKKGVAILGAYALVVLGAMLSVYLLAVWL